MWPCWLIADVPMNELIHLHDTKKDKIYQRSPVALDADEVRMEN